ncbi:MAG: hypothetical protein K9L82_16985 [Chromatiaceae bacterium]|nr:hypothetical protein [Chromatiaceae bacterium]MCF7993860.1 hypothetical protein [Chromatiaceae bacterium]MCF8003880.1 hypothetical protein [Chromatiaceae bacterium]MCF8017153.1 hypothetical protein [Chromatiaceae bacterium]
MPKLDPIERAESQVTAARERLEQALEAGSDSTGPRADLDHALASLDAARAAEAQPEVMERDTSIDTEADALALQATKEISVKIEALCQIEPPKVSISTSAARDLIIARKQAEQAQQRLAEWTERCSNLEQRIADVEGKRQSIIDRRLAGDTSDTDAAELNLAQQDAQALGEMLARVKADRPTLVGLSGPEIQWQRAQAEAQARARVELISQYQERIVQMASIEPRPPYGERCRVHPKIAELTMHGAWG